MPRALGACVLSLSSGRPPFLSQQLLHALEEEGAGEDGAGAAAPPRSLSFAADVGALLPGRQALAQHRAADDACDVRSFFGLRDSLTVVAQIRSALLAPPDSSVAKGAADVVFTTSAMERITIKLEEYLDLAGNVMCADVVVCPYEAIGPGYSRKNADRALKRVLQWTQGALAWRRESKACSTLLVPIVGLNQEAQKRCLEGVKKLVDAETEAPAPTSTGCSAVGFVLGNLRFMEGNEQVLRIREARAQLGSEATLYAVLGSSSVPHLVAALAAGADAVETVLPYTLTKLNTALCFSLDLAHSDSATPPAMTINLADTGLCEDKDPIAAGCPCWACANHTRGYLQHLLSAKELLGQMLLYLHNASMLVRLMDHVRALPSTGAREDFARAWAPGLTSL